MALPLDQNSGLPLDPTTMQALQQQQIEQGIGTMGGTAATRANFQNIQQGMSNLFPSPQVQQATQVQTALKGAQLTQDPGESQLDFNIRQLQSNRDAVAQYSPESAAAMNTQLTKLAQVKFEQSRLTADDQRADERESDVHAAAQAALPGQQAHGALEAATNSTAWVVTPDKTADLGFTAKAFPVTTADATAALTSYAQKTGGAIVSGDKYASMMSSGDVAQMRIAAELARAQATSGGTASPDAIKFMAGESVFDAGALSRAPFVVRQQVAQAKVDAGLSPGDEAQAKLEYKAMQSAVTKAGGREGNMTTLEGSMAGLGNQVIQTLGDVTRTDFQPLNALIRSGKTTFSDPSEQRYADALQSFVNEYARVISGGANQSTDSARGEAWDLIAKNGGPAAIRAAVDQLGNKETGIIAQASQSAVELLAKPNQYPTLTKIFGKLGYKGMLPSDADSAATNTPPAIASPSPNAAPQQLPSGWSVQAH